MMDGWMMQEDPESIQQLVATLEAVKGSMHILLMGAGREEGAVWWLAD